MRATGHGPAKAAKRSNYTQDVELKFHEITATVIRLKEKTERLIASGHLEKSDLLIGVERQVESQIAIVQRQLEQLKDAKHDSWPIRKHELESCWEDLLRSIRNLVARIS